MLLLSASDIRQLLDFRTCIDAVEAGFASHARGETPPAAVCAVHVPGGGFHVKAAASGGGQARFVAKVNANFPANPAERALPTIQGAVALFDAHNGIPLALLDSAEITLRRTAAATAVAVRHLARRDATRMLLCGCGVQGAAHLRALREVLDLSEVLVHDSDAAAVSRFIQETRVEGVSITPAYDLREAARVSDVCITCTSSRDFILDEGDLHPGLFVAGVGVDDPSKRELAPGLLAAGLVVVDLLEQCAAMGDLHHALAAGAMSRDDVHGELGEVVAGLKPGRSRSDEVFTFDSTGTAIQDLAAASVTYDRAIAAGRGARFELRE